MRNQPPLSDSPSIEPARKNFLTPKECAEQFRMYAKSNADKPDAVHHLNFCANFLDEFCVQDGLADALTFIRQIANDCRGVARVAGIDQGERRTWESIAKRCEAFARDPSVP